MIPAVLSCIFVLYLYRTLNAPELDGAAGRVTETSDEIVAIEVRLAKLSQRLDRLSANRKEKQ